VPDDAAKPKPPTPVPTPPPGPPNPTPTPGHPTPSAPPQPTPAPSPETALAFAEQQQQRLDRLEQQARRLEAEAAVREKAERARTVDALCKRWQDEGKVTPAEVQENPRVPNLRTRLLRADNTKALAFGEQSLTDFEQSVAEIEGRGDGFVRLAFSEGRIAQGATGGEPAMSAARRSELLAYTPTGRAILRDEAAASRRAN
jgi:hypothetical protein